MLNVIDATPEQIEKIEKKYLSKPAISLVNKKVAYDSEDNIYFISCKCFVIANSVHMSWQVRNGNPMFFGLTKEQTRYDVAYPKGYLFNVLKKVSDEEIELWKKGNEL